MVLKQCLLYSKGGGGGFFYSLSRDLAMTLLHPEKKIALPEGVMFIELLIKGEAKLSEKNNKIARVSYFCIKMSNMSFF